MTNNSWNMDRFLMAQENIYPIALQELQNGRKRSHWMWYIFPQLKGLEHSYNSNFYGISDNVEAVAYLEHPILGHRVREVSMTILNLPTNNAVAVFGNIDSCKLKSSMTLFDIVSPNDVFALVLNKYYYGLRDTKTIEMLKQ